MSPVIPELPQATAEESAEDQVDGAVELAGTLLLVASIGAIVIAPKRTSGKL